VTATSDVPADNVPPLFKLLPTVTVPKLRLEGDTPSCAGPGPAPDPELDPVPVSAILVGDSGALLLTEILPVEAPAACGAKVTVKETLCPAETVTGKLIPLTE